MQYRKMGKMGWEVSALGFGAMRLPTIKQEDKDIIDEEEAIKMIRYAIDNGVNYVDTAWPYHNQTSEPLVAKALKDGYREKVHLVTKLPVWAVKEQKDFDKYLNQQLERLETEYLDIYLFHALNERSWSTVKELDLISKMEQAKKEGKIKHFGFSFHDSLNQFKEIIDTYDWECCQIQYNYLDQKYQAGREGLSYAASKGIAVIIMEPLRGGALTETNENLQKILETAPKKRKLADWGLQFVWNHPEVSVALSGMSTFQHVEENVESASKSGINSLSQAQLDTIELLRQEYQSRIEVPCTQCKYCMPCPQGVNIPSNMQLLNRIKWSGPSPWVLNQYKRFAKTEEELEKSPNNGAASLCIECGECLEKCPQNIHIPNELIKIQEEFNQHL